jgi:hypothetical protein
MLEFHDCVRSCLCHRAPPLMEVVHVRDDVVDSAVVELASRDGW